MPIDYGYTAEDLAREIRWTCPTCITDHDEPWCSSCGRMLNVSPLHPPGPHSVRVRPDADMAEVRRLVDTYGVQRAAAVVPLVLIERMLGSRR